jgi:predicted nucleic acid-binding protein
VNVQAWFSIVNPADIYLSVLVVGEIRQGIERLQGRDPTQAAVYDNWLETLRQDYVDRILPITEEVAQEWGRINFPNPVPVVDGLMAATAKVKGMTLVTRNTADVASTGVSLLNPFNPSN